MPDSSLVVLGIRHHGPGSARAVERALEHLQPVAVVVEGPSELDGVVSSLASSDMKPPVAGLVYDVKSPKHASFYPLASFSPEWVALRWALANEVPASFADLPAANYLAIEAERRAEQEALLELHEPSTDDDNSDDGGQADDSEPIDDPLDTEGVGSFRPPSVTADPISTLAAVAGYDDAERWWEDAVELRIPDDPVGQFGSVSEAMAVYREKLPDRDGFDALINEQREASMRKILRKVIKAHDGTVVMVCGAFHASALEHNAWPSASVDNTTLKGLPKTRVAATWAPWTNRRLSFSSGYGAGVSAPGWYDHLFSCRHDVIATWMVRTASLLRQARYDASPASVVEATRMAEALASLRGRPLAGMTEVADASQAVLGQGFREGLDVVSQELWVGSTLGSVPEDTPMVPLAEDLARLQKSLRLKPSAEEKTITLDLRTESQRERSVLFRRLTLLGIPWAIEQDSGRTGGTFKEVWTVEWQPEFAVAIIEASLHGTTVSSAANAKAISESAEAGLAELASLVGLCLLSELDEAVAMVLQTLSNRTAEQSDHLAVMQTIEPLARSVRYGDVRELDTAALRSSLETLVRRSSVGLVAACATLDDPAAMAMRDAINAVDRSVNLLEDVELAATWRTALAGLSEHSVHGLVVGRASRMLLDSGAMDADTAGARLGRALSPAMPPAHSAAWLDGFLEGDISLLLHDEQIFLMIDDWLTSLPGASFDDLLPIVRRTFSSFEQGERRQLGDLVVRGSDNRTVIGELEVDVEQAAPAVAAVAALMGLEQR